MADHQYAIDIDDGERSSGVLTIDAGAVDTVTFNGYVRAVEVLWLDSVEGAVTTDGTAPQADGADKRSWVMTQATRVRYLPTTTDKQDTVVMVYAETSGRYVVSQYIEV